MKTKKTEAIVLARRPFKEKDLLVDFFSPTLGRCRAVAKSAVGPKSKLHGTCEPTSLVDIVLYKGAGLYTLIEADVTKSHDNLRGSFNAISVASHLLTVILKSTSEHQANPPLFSILEHSLSQLDEVNLDIHLVRLWFYTAFLKAEGVYDTPITTEAEFFAAFEGYTGLALTRPILI